MRGVRLAIRAVGVERVLRVERMKRSRGDPFRQVHRPCDRAGVHLGKGVGGTMVRVVSRGVHKRGQVERLTGRGNEGAGLAGELSVAQRSVSVEHGVYDVIERRHVSTHREVLGVAGVEDLSYGITEARF